MSSESERRQMLADAFNHIQSAIELLDQAGAAGQIAAHLDLALHQLQGELAAVKAAPRPIACH